MIELKLHEQLFSIPNSWNELTRKQYSAVCAVINGMQQGGFSLYDARLKIFSIVTGYKRSKKRFGTNDQQQVNDNIAILSGMTDFVFKPVYDDDAVMQVFSEPLCEKLKTTFPFDIYDPEYRAQLDMVGDRLQYKIGLKLNMHRNPLPDIRIRFTQYYGPLWLLDDNNLLTTDIKAEEYIDALDYYKLYRATGNEKYLGGMIAAFYRKNRETYRTVEVQQRASVMANLSPEVKNGVFWFFQSVQEYLYYYSPWSLLFEQTQTGTEEEDDKLSLGMIEVIYGLVKEGYGNKEELAVMNIKDMFNLMLKQLMDTVKTLRANGMKNHKIAAKLKMKIETIQKI